MILVCKSILMVDVDIVVFSLNLYNAPGNIYILSIKHHDDLQVCCRCLYGTCFYLFKQLCK